MHTPHFDPGRRAAHCRLLALTLGATTVAGLRTAHANRFPERILTLVVPQPAGGTGDFVSRVIAQRMGEALHQNVIVDNKPGAGGLVGAGAVAKAPPDGYSMVLASPSFATFSTLYPRSPDPMPKLAPVGMIGSAPVTLLMRKGAPYKTVLEFVAYAKANPGKTAFSSAGQGSLSHLLGTQFVMEAKLDTNHIPYSGTAPALTALMGGQVDIYFDSAAGTELVRSGKLLAAATAGATRPRTATNLPTMKELGYDVQGAVWLGLMATAGTPPAILELLNQALNSALATPEVRTSLAMRDMEPDPMTASAFAAFLANESKVLNRVVKQAGMKVD